jgi:hypothetical protein
MLERGDFKDDSFDKKNSLSFKVKKRLNRST